MSSCVSRIPSLLVASALAFAVPLLAQEEEEPLSCPDACHANAMERHEAGMPISENNYLYIRCVEGC